MSIQVSSREGERTVPWPTGAPTGVGSMPRTDPREAATVVVGELPEFPHLPELPARGLGADMIGRTAGLLVDLAVEAVPSGYRATARPGRDHRRAVDLLRRDLDAFEEAIDRAGVRPGVVKVQLVGPWTLASEVELPRGHRVLTDSGALREFTESLCEGLSAHVAEVGRRAGEVPVVVQLDEPSLPSVLAGAVSTPSGLGTVAAVPEPEVSAVLGQVVTAARAASGQPVVAHCCGRRPPVALLRNAGADAIGLDATTLDGAPAALADEIGEAWDAGVVLFLGLVPGTPPPRPLSLAEAAAPALRLVDRLGFDRSLLVERAVATPCCGLAGATVDWSRRALALVRDLGKAFVEPPESW